MYSKIPEKLKLKYYYYLFFLFSFQLTVVLIYLNIYKIFHCIVSIFIVQLLSVSEYCIHKNLYLVFVVLHTLFIYNIFILLLSVTWIKSQIISILKITSK